MNPNRAEHVEFDIDTWRFHRYHAYQAETKGVREKPQKEIKRKNIEEKIQLWVI